MQSPCGGGCSITYAAATDLNNPAKFSIQQVRRVQINYRTGAEVAGTSQVIPAGNLPRGISNALRAHLRRFVWDAIDCPLGCYCDSFGEITTETVMHVLNTSSQVEEDTVQVWALVNPPGAAGNQLVEAWRKGRFQMKDFGTNQPHPFNGDLERVRWLHVNCCGQPTLEVQLQSLFQYSIRFSIELILMTEKGICRPLEGEGGGVVA